MDSFFYFIISDYRYPDHEVIIGINTLGKEDLLVEISRALQIMVSS